jgi:hypothetical protein
MLLIEENSYRPAGLTIIGTGSRVAKSSTEKKGE